MSNHVAIKVATVFHVGYLPVAPGTWASLVTCIPALLLPSIVSWWFYVGIVIISMIGGFWSVPKVQSTMGHDPSQVVIDEVAGMSIVCLVPDVLHSPLWLLVAFVVFRVLDIVKPWPANILNNRTEGWAVLADDIVAAIYTVVVMYLAVFTLQVAIIWLESL